MSETLIKSDSLGGYKIITHRIKPVGKAPKEYHTTLQGERGAHSVRVTHRLYDAERFHEAVVWTLYVLEVE